MQELLPGSASDIDLAEVFATVGTAIGEGVEISTLDSDAEHTVLICGRVGSVDLPNATLVIGLTGAVHGSIVARKLIHFGQIGVDKAPHTRTSMIAMEIIAASGSKISHCDVFYDKLQTHGAAKMVGVTLDGMKSQLSEEVTP